MTADDARRLTEKASSVDGEKVQLVLKFWRLAIEKAASEGRTSVRESAVDKPRTSIPTAAQVAAQEQLRRDGFTVVSVEDGPNEKAIEVSWGRAGRPPLGGVKAPKLRT
jgi:hypothetical protein